MRLSSRFDLVAVVLLAASLPGLANAVPVYLNDQNITVAIGPGTSAGSFNNTFAGGGTVNKIIDAPNAAASENHNQTTHFWFTAATIGGGLELLFDFGQEYDLTTLHFWNYFGEGFDVDNIDFTFFNGLNSQVGALSIAPALGGSGGNPIFAEDIALAAPLNVQFVTAFLSGSNRQVDFNNMGFTGQLSVPLPPTDVPEPGTLLLFFMGLVALTVARRRFA